MEDFGRALTWDDQIEKEAEFEVLPEGTYDFVVEAMERGQYNGSERMSACPMASLTLAISDPATGKKGRVFDTLYLHSKAEWRLSQFFISIGQKKKGEAFRPNWTLVPAARGKVEIFIDKYKDKSGKERESNRVSKYLPFTPASFAEGGF